MSGIKLIERGKGSELLRKHCRDHDVPIQLLRELVEVEVQHRGRARRHGIYQQIDELLARTTEESTHVP